MAKKMTLFLSVFFATALNTPAQEYEPMPGIKTIIIKSVSYDKDGSETRRYEEIEKFNKEGRVVERQRYWNGTESLGWDIYKYDDKGNEIEIEFYNSDGALKSKYRTEYKYSEKGLKEEKRSSDLWGRLIFLTIYKYDDQGKLLKEFVYTDAELFSMTSFEYNEKGRIKSRLTKLCYWNPSETRLDYRYSENGKLVRRDEYELVNGKADHLYATLEYDGNERLKSWEYIKEGIVTQKKECDYDQQGYLKEEREYWRFDDDNVLWLHYKVTYEYKQ